jgi:hypothetical protein
MVSDGRPLIRSIRTYRSAQLRGIPLTTASVHRHLFTSTPHRQIRALLATTYL